MPAGTTITAAYQEPNNLRGQYELRAFPALYRVSGKAPLVAASIGSAVALTHGLLIKADPSNTDKIYLGESASITADSGLATSGYPLEAGQEFLVYPNSPSLVYVIASVADQAYVALGEKAV